MRLRNACKNSVFEASKLVSTKTLLLKHYYRRYGFRFVHRNRASSAISAIAIAIAHTTSACGDKTIPCQIAISGCSGRLLAIAFSSCHFRAENPFFEAAPRPSLFRGFRQFVWNHLESVSCHFCGKGFWSSVE